MCYAPRAACLAEGGTTHTSQLDPKLWIAAGYNADDARAYCDDLKASLTHPNSNLAVRFPGGFTVIGVMQAMAGMVMAMPTEQVAAFGAGAVRKALLDAYVSKSEHAAVVCATMLQLPLVLP